MIKIIAIAVVIASILAVLLLQYPTGQVIASQDIDFKVFTQAVCEPRGDREFCQDRIFYSCDGLVKPADSDVVYCKNKSISLGQVNLGSAEIVRK